jgi:hypothetical protein
MFKQKSTQQNQMIDETEMEMDSDSIQNIMNTVWYWKTPRSGESYLSRRLIVIERILCLPLSVRGRHSDVNAVLREEWIPI